MKQNVLIKLAAVPLLLLSIMQYGAANNITPLKPWSDSLLIQPHSFIKKNMVKLYPNPSPDGTITITSTAEEELHFYVFDLEATLLYRITLKGKEKKVVPNLKKGIYTYDIFENDISIEQGSITVK